MFFRGYSSTGVSFPVAQMVKNLPAMQETWVDPCIRKIPGEGNDNPLQYSCLETSWTEEPSGLVHGVAKSQTQLSK